MFSRVKQSRHGEYLQVVESYREGGKVRQRLILYVGHYDSLDDALGMMPRELRGQRGHATRAENLCAFMGEDARPEDRKAAEDARRWAAALAERLEALRRLVDDHPDLLERDRERAERHARRRGEAMARRRAARQASR